MTIVVHFELRKNTRQQMFLEWQKKKTVNIVLRKKKLISNLHHTMAIIDSRLLF